VVERDGCARRCGFPQVVPGHPRGGGGAYGPIPSGDGELEEGQVWEAAMSASKNKLDNLCAIVDYNTLQIDGNVEEVAGLIDIKEKFESFGFNVIEVNGHDIEALIHAFNSAKHQKDMPSVIIARTIKGKGVSFMEGKAEWHGKAPNQEQYEEAINELKLQHIIG